ncbi:Hint domain-containing protein [Actibacterium ureilyticum]|uniref:Hint domain-containing protein n=1 Tax=Actibacterium ureilyticum TaxID=1590614 RepID=UPI001140A20E|nr:Hint domain-containing protein [Actibacterium ureilyticum]
MATMVSGLGGPAGYGENVFSSSPKAAGGNDDGSVAIDTTSVFGPSGINFFGTDYTTIYLNSNGVISFGAPETSFQTPDYTAETTPNIAVFWADVNINSGGEIYWDIDPAAGTITMTWLDVAPYSGSGTNSFQVILTDTGGGGFSVQYIYEDIQWTNGGGNSAAAGVTDGGSYDYTLEGSGDPAQLINYDTNDFDGGDPAGSFVLDFAAGEPVIPDGTVEGTSGADVIDASYAGDPQGEVVDGGDGTGAAGNEDVIDAGAGDDTVLSGDEADTVYGGAGNDSIDGGAGNDLLYGEGDSDIITGGDGNDTIYGDFETPPPAATNENLHWADQGADESSLTAGFTQNTGSIDVTVDFTDDGNAGSGTNPGISVESTTTNYVAGGEPYDPQSSAQLWGEGTGDTSTTNVSFAAANGVAVDDQVADVSFRINDIDAGNNSWLDVITVNAFDIDGNPVAVTITPAGDDTVSGNTITAGPSPNNYNQAEGSALVEIAGPVAYFEVIYQNAGTSGQAITVTDVHFTTIPLIEGDDVIDGGIGADEIFAGAGDDTITVAEGDTVSGGDGDDTFLITDLGEAGSAAINIVGGEGDETAGDTLDFQGLINQDAVTITNADDNAGGLSGFATLSDGTVVNFSEIETLLICFTAGTGILTPQGQRPIEDLRPGDLVLTADHGLQPIRWIGQRTVPAQGNMAPVLIREGVFNNARDLLVSPQHRMLIQGYQAQLITGQSEVFATAKHLIDGTNVLRHAGGTVTYVHLMFDRHEVIFAEGAATESFHPGQVGLDAVLAPAREELFRIFPELRSNPNAYGPTSRTCLRRPEARALLAA